MLKYSASFLVLLVPFSLPVQGQSKDQKAIAKQAKPLQILVPAYFYPAGDNLKLWDKLAKAAKTSGVPIVAIVNPNSGPGKTADQNYLAVIRKMNAAGVITIGYVATGYGKRDAGAVEADIATWGKLYPEIKGFFLDEQPSDADSVKKIQAWCTAIRMAKPKALIISNPGTVCDSGFFKTGGPDIICVHETKASLEQFEPNDELMKLRPNQLAALVHTLPAKDKMANEVALARKKGIGCLFVTDQKMPNPWGKLPAYWDDLVTASK